MPKKIGPFSYREDYYSKVLFEGEECEAGDKFTGTIETPDGTWLEVKMKIDTYHETYSEQGGHTSDLYHQRLLCKAPFYGAEIKIQLLPNPPKGLELFDVERKKK